MLAGKEVELKFEALNLTGRNYQEVQESGDNRIYFNRYKLGRTFSLSASVKFSYRGNEVRGIGNRHPDRVSGFMAFLHTKRCAVRENRPWMIEQVRTVYLCGRNFRFGYTVSARFRCPNFWNLAI